jgi:hypothetical protein
MLAIIIYIGLFVWGMNSERLSWRHAAVIGAVFVAQTGMFYAVAGGELLRTGAMSLMEVLAIVGLEGLIDVAVFFAGYGVGRYRRRRHTPDDVADTFS